MTNAGTSLHSLALQYGRNLHAQSTVIGPGVEVSPVGSYSVHFFPTAVSSENIAASSPFISPPAAWMRSRPVVWYVSIATMLLLCNSARCRHRKIADSLRQ